MREDSALFKYELAVVLIAKNETPYIREWINYHLLAGVDHFYIYDNDSEDDLKGELQEYVDASVVDYIPLPGKNAQMLAYNDAVARFKFDCRYMAFIDADEFIRPIDQKQTIKDVLHEVLDEREDAAGLASNWHIFGAGGNEKADLETGVLERFTQRTPNEFHVDETLTNTLVKTIANPRCVEVMINPHFALYFPGKIAVDEAGREVASFFNPNVPADKIIIHHYVTKSKEEFEKKLGRGRADLSQSSNTMDIFYSTEEASTVKDESILEYRQARYDALSKDDEIQIQMESDDAIDYRLFQGLVRHLMPAELRSTPQEFYEGRLHEFLTCRAIAESFSDKAISRSSAENFEQIALQCIYRSLSANGLQVWQLLLLIEELPKLFARRNEDLNEIKHALRQLIPQIMMQCRLGNDWQRHAKYKYVLEMIGK